MLYGRLKAGTVPDLHDQPDGTQAALVPGGQLKTLLGFGGPAFTLTSAGFGQPPNLRDYAFQQAVAGAPIARMAGKDSGIHFGSSQAELTDVAGAAFAVQFTAQTPLAVERGVVETWKLLRDKGDPAPLELGGVFTGAQRDDARSWIDFHDGLSNVKPVEREGVISVPGADWTARGTYLAFARLSIDLEVWRRHDRREQELMVGRNKVSGCAFSEFDAAGRGYPRRRLPARNADHGPQEQRALLDDDRPSWWSPALIH